MPFLTIAVEFFLFTILPVPLLKAQLLFVNVAPLHEAFEEHDFVQPVILAAEIVFIILFPKNALFSTVEKVLSLELILLIKSA